MRAAIARPDVLTKRLHAYSFLQRRESPLEALELFSTNGDVGAIEEPLGEPEARYRPSLVKRGAYDLVAEVEGPPETPTTSFTESMPRATATFLEDLKVSGERFTVHNIISQSADPQDWTAYESKEVLSGARLTSFTRGELGGSENDLVNCEGEASYLNSGRIFPIAFASKGGTEITKEIMDVVVYPKDWRADAKRKQLYAVQKVDTGSPKLIYSLNGGQTIATVTLTALSTNEPLKLVRVGRYLIIISNGGLSYYYARISDLTAWTGVTGGFVASKGPNAVYAPAVGDIWMAADGGYIYKLGIPGQAVTVIEDGDLSVQNLKAIHGKGDTLLAVGASNTVLLSVNHGRGWRALTGPAVCVALNCCGVIDQDKFWVGGDKLYYTEDQGVTWYTIDTGIAGLTQITDIEFCEDLPAVGVVAGIGTGPAGEVRRTSDNGASWEEDTITGLGANERINALAVGGPNYILAGGLNTAAGGDGVLFLASQ